MSKQYSPKTFLRQVRGTLVNRCLRRRGVELDLNREILKPSVIDDLFCRLVSLPPDTLRLVEGDFAEITDLACPAGANAILREAQRAGEDITIPFNAARNDYERACWTFLEHPSIFELAACFVEMDRTAFGRWDRRHVGAGLVPVTSAQGLAQLTDLLRQSFAEEGRGRYCHIDHYVRHDPERHCYFAYPEDRASSDLGYNDDGQLQRLTRKSAFEVIFVYRPEEGMLEVLAPGGKGRVEDLASCFCTCILGLPDLPPRLTPQLYDLSVLKSASVDFPIDEADGIDAVILREVRLQLPRHGGWRRRVVFSRDPAAAHRASIHDLIAATVTESRLSLVDVVVAYARLTLVFGARDGKRAKRMTFSVGLPDHCSLKDDPYDHIARKYLYRWGFHVDGVGANPLARIGRAGERAIQLRRRAGLAAGVA
jgi:hypothetical protein